MANSSASLFVRQAGLAEECERCVATARCRRMHVDDVIRMLHQILEYHMRMYRCHVSVRVTGKTMPRIGGAHIHRRLQKMAETE